MLRGATALALPLRQGQTMEVTEIPGKEALITWTALDPEGIWFSAELANRDTLEIVSCSDLPVADKLRGFLLAAMELNPGFLRSGAGYRVSTQLEFNRNWGWGSSSTLLANLAAWAGIDPFTLNSLVSKGSGYDIACALSDGPVTFRKNDERPDFQPIAFRPAFRNHLAFIYLGRKQDTSEEIGLFAPDDQQLADAIPEINYLTRRIAVCAGLLEFNALLSAHETIISELLGRPAAGDQYFRDFPGVVKSLGAWGGDFILASSEAPFDDTADYFRRKGYPLSFTWDHLIR